MDSTRHYSTEEIIALSLAIKKEEDSFKWLLNNAKELAALADYLAFGNDKALSWLKDNHYFILVAFVSALGGHQEAIAFLLNSPFKEWAATAKAVSDDDENAKEWLSKFDMKPFLALIDSLQQQANSGNGSAGGGFGGGGGGGGFSGFGGGASGGGGAGGAW